MTNNAAVNDVEVAKILMQEYLSARQEVLLHIQHFKTQERFATLILAIGAISISILSGQSVTIFGSGVASTPWIILVFLFTISTGTYFFLFSALSSQFALQVLAERCVRLEDEMNRLLRGPYLLWERLSQLIWSNRSVLVYKMPDTAQAVCSSLLVTFFAVIIPLCAIAKMRCEGLDRFLLLLIYAYTFYLLTMCIVGIQIGFYSTAAVRDDCRQLFRFATLGGDKPTISSGLTRVLSAVSCAAVLAAIFLYLVPRSGACSYLVQK